MGKFITSLQLEQIREATPIQNALYKVTSPLIYESKTLASPIYVPTGFTTDLASMPRIPFLYAMLGGLGNYAAVLHDYLYTYPHKVEKNSNIVVSRKVADKVLCGAVIDGMIAKTDDTMTLKAAWNNIWYICIGYCFYIGVRIGGSSHWKDRIEEKECA